MKTNKFLIISPALLLVMFFPSAAANQLAAAANKQSSNPFAVSYLTLVYIEYAVIFGIPTAVGAVVIVAYKRR